MQERICVAVTGASGSPYALRLTQVLLAAGKSVDMIISKAAQLVIATETDLSVPGNARAQADMLQQYFQVDGERLRVFGREDWMAPWASGSGQPGPVVICPCSTGTLSAIATGASNNLTERAADVALKERRQLILVPREAPYSEIHLHMKLGTGAIFLCINEIFFELI